MSDTQAKSGWNILPPVTVPAEDRLDHVRSCSDFAAGLLDRFPDQFEAAMRVWDVRWRHRRLRPRDRLSV